MLRPEQMSKLSVTGSKRVMSDVIETLHQKNIVHITDYDGSWEGFTPGDSLEGADETSSQLVTVRALENKLDLDEADLGPAGTVDLTDADERLEEIREQVNELDDRRDELRNRRRDIDEQLAQMELFADLGIDLDLLWGYDSLDVLVGEGDATEIDSTLTKSEDVNAHDVFRGSDPTNIAIFAYMEEGTLDDALVGVPFTSYEVPETSGDPESNVAELRQEHKQIETELEKVDNELESLRLDAGHFLLALEEELTIEAEKSEAPLRFATTKHSFIVEGWVPTEKYDELAAELEEEIGGKLEISELKRAAYTEQGGHHEEEVHNEGDGGEEVAADGGKTAGGAAATNAAADTDEEVVTDGGHSDGDLVTVDDEPPVIQQNSKIVNPFEILVKAVNQPKYSEFDPTVIVFLTFPIFFGFMIGDIGYGLLYILIGYGVYRSVNTKTLADFGTVVAWLGIWTIVFGVFYGEIFGLHFLEWFGMHPPLEKGITDEAWAISWLLIAVVVGWLHLNVGYVINFIEEYQIHGTKEAIVEVGSWLLILNGIWLFVFSHLGGGGKPGFLVGDEALFATGPLGFGFTGFPEFVGIIGIVAVVAGMAILATGPWYELFEVVVPFAHALSYTRLTAVLLAKAGMAVVANLLYFGAYLDDDGFHFIHEGTPAGREAAGENVIFDGIANLGTEISIGAVNLGIEGAILGIPILIIGHLVVLAIGGTAAIQAIRLEYFEFFEKFYEGGGRNYEPFGHERTHTDDTSN